MAVNSKLALLSTYSIFWTMSHNDMGNERNNNSQTAKEGKGGRASGAGKPELQLLHDMDGVFRPGVLTALMGASGAGKTT